MKSEEKFIRRKKGGGVRAPKRIKNEKSGPDAGTKMEPAASEVSGKADCTESRAHVNLPAMSQPPGVVGNAKLRNSLRKYDKLLSPFQLANFDLLDCFDEIRHKEELMEEYSRMVADPCIPPAEAQRFREKAFRLLCELLCLRDGRLPQLKSDLAVARRMGELDQEKLTPLLRLKYNNSLADALADLGRPEEIATVFAGFQKYLYRETVVA